MQLEQESETVQDPDYNLIYEARKTAIDNRCLLINGPISKNLVETVWLQAEILKGKNDQENIDLYINSEGGDANVSMFISDYIRSNTTPIKTIGIGECCSGAFIILVSGLYRYCYANTTLMMHNVSSGILEADAKSTRSHAKNLEDMWKRIVKLLSEQSKLKEIEIETYINENREWYITAEQALKYSFIDEIIEPKFKYKNRKSWSKNDKKK